MTIIRKENPDPADEEMLYEILAEIIYDEMKKENDSKLNSEKQNKKHRI